MADLSSEDRETPVSHFSTRHPVVNEGLAVRTYNAEEKTQTGPDVSEDHKYFPTRVESFFGLGARKVKESPFWEIPHVIGGELGATLVKWLPLYLVIGTLRSVHGTVSNPDFHVGVYLAALVFSAMSHFFFRRLSCDANPLISIFRAPLNDSTRWPMKFSGVVAKPDHWMISSWVMLIAKLVTQAVASLIVVIGASFLDVTGDLGFPGTSGDYDAAGFPYMVASPSGGYAVAGSLVFIACFIEGLTFLTMQLEFVKIRGHGLQSLYIGMGTAAAYMVSFYATGTPLNMFNVLMKMMYHQKSTDQPLTAIFVPMILGFGFAQFIWYFVVRVTSQSGVWVSNARKQKGLKDA